MAGICSFLSIVLIGMSASIKGKCLNDNNNNNIHNNTTTANDFLISKWKMYYKGCDVNHDGIVNKTDVEESGNMFSDLEHLDAETKKNLTKVFTQVWNECVFMGKQRDLFEREFVDAFKTFFNANKEMFVNERRRCFELFFYAIDINEDKSISKEEFQIANTAFGHPHVANDTDNFSAYGPKDGLVPVCTVVNYWVEFLTVTDESKGNAVKSAYEADGFE